MAYSSSCRIEIYPLLFCESFYIGVFLEILLSIIAFGG